MKIAGILILLISISMNDFAQTAQELAQIWEKQHVTNKFPSDVRHNDLKNYLEQLKKLGIKVDEVGPERRRSRDLSG